VAQFACRLRDKRGFKHSPGMLWPHYDNFKCIFRIPDRIPLLKIVAMGQQVDYKKMVKYPEETDTKLQKLADQAGELN